MAPMSPLQNHAGHRAQAVVRFCRTPRPRVDNTVRSSVRLQTAPHASHQASGRMVAINMKAIPYLQAATVVMMLGAGLFFGLRWYETATATILTVLAIVMDNRMNR